MTNNSKKSDFKSGFVAILGRPNVGKSTLLNTVLQNKVAIVTNKAQTTRNRIQGIYHGDNEQIVFIDTPGVHHAHHEMGKLMNKTALSATKGVDLILFLAPLNERIGENDQFILKVLAERKLPTFLVLTKADLVDKQEVMVKIDEWQKLYDFQEIIPIAAIENFNINLLLDLIKKQLPVGPKYYDDDIYTDQPEKFLIREIIREKILILTNQEVPHSVAILIDKIEENAKSKVLHIMASIVVERASQKPILIGKQGQLIKQIGIAARTELETILSTKIYLELFVKVEEHWRDKPSMIAKLGYNKETY